MFLSLIALVLFGCDHGSSTNSRGDNNQESKDAVNDQCSRELGIPEETCEENVEVAERVDQVNGQETVVTDRAYGSLDTEFGDNGLTLLTYEEEDVQVVDVQEAPDGGFIVLGRFYSGSSFLKTIILKLNSDGSPNESFGTGGYAVYSQSGDLKPRILSVSPGTGVIHFFGAHTRFIGGTTRGWAFGAQLSENGIVNPNFGLNGYAKIDPHNQENTEFLGVTIGQDDTATILFSFRNPSAVTDTYQLARISSNGNIDSVFGTPTLGSSSASEFNNIVMEKSNNAIICGRSLAQDDPGFHLRRVGSDGAGIDAVTVPWHLVENGGAGFCSSIITGPEGTLLLAGRWFDVDGNGWLRIGRIKPDFSLDESFGEKGYFTVINDPDNRAFRVKSTSQGQLLVFVSSATQWFVTRLTAEGNLDVDFGEAGRSGSFPTENPADAYLGFTVLKDDRLLIWSRNQLRRLN